MKKFGLILPDSKDKNKTTVANKIKVASIFEDNDDDEYSDEESELIALRKKKASIATTTSISNSEEFVSKLHEEALREDPTIFDYDNLIEISTSNQNKNKNNSKETKMESKYMKNLLAKAEERKIESELIKVRNMKRKANFNSNSDEKEEIFVTSAYSEKLKELEVLEKELKAKQIREDDGDVSKRKDMSGFYFNLMRRNVSFGGELREENDMKDKQEVKKFKTENIVIENTKEATANETEETICFGPRRPPIKK